MLIFAPIPMKLVIIKYNAGNTRSVAFALQRLGIEPVITDEPEVITSADKVIFPGVGEASTAMRYLKERRLDALIPSLTQPVLGVCLGLQLMCTHSEENDTPCMGIFPVQVKRFPPEDKVPHMGWNLLTDRQGALFQGMPERSFVYYVHSYYAELSPYTTARSAYIVPFSASLQKDNFYALQAHPEKSSEPGSLILQNFLKL
jgi:glutamine amidotransferase